MKILNTHFYSLAIVLSSVWFSSACISVQYEPTTVELGAYHVSVKPHCNSTSTTTHERSEQDGTTRVTHYEFTCGDVTVLIRDNTLTVNGKSYGVLEDGDQIAIYYGKVRVNSEVREEVR